MTCGLFSAVSAFRAYASLLLLEVASGSCVSKGCFKHRRVGLTSGDDEPLRWGLGLHKSIHAKSIRIIYIYIHIYIYVLQLAQRAHRHFSVGPG